MHFCPLNSGVRSMTPQQFRVLLVAYVISAAANFVISLTEFGYSPSLTAAYASQPDSILVLSPLVLVVLAILLLGGSLAGVVGLFRFKRWGRSLSAWTTALLLLFVPFLGPYQTTPFEDFFADIATLLWGAAVALSYFTPLSLRFTTSNNEASPPT